ncbi:MULTISPECIES: DeoR/GlpR family DNA-binding transcription regulator [unclassified Moritella]|uniref:DeoR/GlpR family DNA-binding transcription regulator n=1 Tax=unclassified Moritella TaxID=2637987 RepID=UPI001BA49DAB|nr:MULTISPECIES: DeoR/GlpR family DNA-binding transcription regulator [unclassified Moritella]QUM86751.1 DeoR/GlpR transcriptional regulator [Moritella sp. 28]QUM90978.1 DeoR/GlpR transcriptional regulator [Moritella sp. 36]
MELNQRQQQILQRLKQVEGIQIDELAAYFDVTTQTIRRDVNQLCEQGIARRIHGGVSLPALLTNTTYQFRADVETGIKDKLAKEVANAIPDGSTVMMGIGTTITRIAHYLLHKKSLRVITNNLQVARILELNKYAEVYIAGGLFRSEHQDIVGNSVLAFFGGFEADIGIVSCGSITKSQAAMEHETQEAELSRCILDNARQGWLVADTSKWSRFASVKVRKLNEFDRIYTNKTGLPAELPIHVIENESR